MIIATEDNRRSPFGWLAAGFTALVALIVLGLGGLLAWKGLALMQLGGSWYYLLAGAALVISGILLLLRRTAGAYLFALTLLATFAWALWEAGTGFWVLLPRLFGPAVIGILVVIAIFGLKRSGRRRGALLLNGLGVVLCLGVLGLGLANAGKVGVARNALPLTKAATGPETGWRYYGRDPSGTRYAPAAAITRENVGDLAQVWQIRTGDIASDGSEDQTTPSFIGDTLYVCTPKNVVLAIDPATGKEKWRHDPKVEGGFWNRCRGVGYHETAVTTPAAPVQSAAAPALCTRRIISTTIDARIFALDAATGQRCPNFGNNGEVSLRAGMGEIKKGFYFPTSAPTVAGDLIIIGGWVQDNTELSEPSGVVRAFSAITGDLAWAFDLGDPTITKLPPEGKSYTRGTPNVWSTPAFDPQLGLIYLPVGNATPDYWGSHRSDIADQYSSSVVALDYMTGRERWKFQTVHHDVWDYDVPAQPMLIDWPDGRGGSVPALVQLTKRGQIFVLDRRTGQPLTPVEEKPTPQDAAPGEWVTPTQPYSTGMPTITAERITEKMMWGITPLDQLLCRIQFRKTRYKGDFTPPATEPTLQYPGNGGGQNWGSGAYDPNTGTLITTGLRNPITVQLIKSDRPTMQLSNAPNRSARGAGAIPYQVKTPQFLTPVKLGKGEDAKPMGTPCLAPPHGVMTAVDLKTRQIAWQIPVGTAEKSGPFGWESGFKVRIGAFGIGGVTTTGGGLVFHAATQDPYLRAYDTSTGAQLWESRLPVGAGGTPMTFVHGGRQYVVVTAGGARRMPDRGDYVVAYALPN